MASFYQTYKTPILSVLIILAIIGNIAISSRTWLKGIFTSETFDALNTNLVNLVGLSGEDFASLPSIPKSLETTVLQDSAFLTLESLPVLETIKPRDIIVDDDPLASFGQVRVSNSGIGNSLIITWQEPAVTNLQTIRIYRSTRFGSLGNIITEATPDQRSYKDSNVITGSTYYYTLRGVSAGGEEASQTYQYPGKAIDILPPDSPTNIAISTTNSSATITWTEPTSDDYDFSRVYRSTLPGQLGKLLADSIHSGEYTDSTIIPGVTYYYTVTSVDTSLNESARNTSPSLARQVSEKTGILAKGDILLLITNIQAVGSDTGNAITLSWNNPDDSAFASVRLYRSLTFNDPGILLANVPSSVNEYKDNSVSRETVYYYTLRTVDTEGRESDNVIQYVAVARDSSGPEVPKDISVTQSLPSVVDIAWSRPEESDLAYYRIYRSTDKDSYGHLVADEVITQTWQDTDIEDNKVYYYVVTAVDTSGNESRKPIPTGVIGGRIPFLPFEQ